MRYRLDILKEHNIRLADIQAVIETLKPLDGAKAFLDDLRSRTRVILLSDTFAEFAAPLMAQLDYPTLFCHNLEVSAEDEITGYRLRLTDHKRKAVEAFRQLNFHVIAAGDSYNDISMLKAADQGMLFCPSDNVVADYPEFPVCRDHGAFSQAMQAFLKER